MLSGYAYICRVSRTFKLQTINVDTIRKTYSIVESNVFNSLEIEQWNFWAMVQQNNTLFSCSIAIVYTCNPQYYHWR